MIKFTKPAGEGVKIYSRRGAETEFMLIGMGTSPPFIDRRLKLDSTKPEKREYYAFLFEKDLEIGRQSDVIEVIIS